MSLRDMKSLNGAISANNKEEIIQLLRTDVFSDDYYELLSAANKFARTTYKKGYLFTQIGINSAPCTGDCKFCSLAKSTFTVGKISEKSIREIVEEAKIVAVKSSDIFLMTTADYDKEKFLDIVKAVRAAVPSDIKIVANVGDFDYDYARKLLISGANGCYHIRRLREGKDTLIDPSVRENTIIAIKKAGLDLYYCIEPIGKEHSYEEIADEIVYFATLGIDSMAVMKRISVPGTALSGGGEITCRELSKIAAVTMLAVKPKRSMNAHESNAECMLAGVNQLYAEYGLNPRDVGLKTENGRGLSIEQAEAMLLNSNWTI